MSLTISQAKNDLLSKLGFENPAAATENAIQDVTIAINAAFQILQTAGEDWFTSEELVITLAAGTATYTLPTAIQSVQGPVLWNGAQPLEPLLSKGEVDQFSRIFLGGTDYGSGANGEPIAYWVEYKRSGSVGDICATTITVCPAPTAPAGTITIDVINGAPSFTTAQINTGTSVLPIAQDYAETIFLPIARMLVTRSSLFSRPDLIPQFTADAKVAMDRLGLSGGFPPAKQETIKRETK